MAGRIPQSFIDELMNRVDIVDVIEPRVPLKKAGREYTACCPFHNEKTPSFTVSASKQFYHCFGCRAHGTAVGFLMEYEHMSFPEAIEELARSVGLEVPYEGPQPAERKSGRQNEDLYALLTQADQLYRQQLRQHASAARAVDYLKARGLSGQIAADFGIGYAPPGWDNLLNKLGANKQLQDQLVQTGMLIRKDDGKCYDRFRDRIMFPIQDRRGRTIAFGGRVLGEDTPKYLNSPETPLFHKGRELYGLYEARKALRDIPRLLVVEGYMDVVSLAQFDIRYTVATLGTATTADHLHRLFRMTPEVVFCFDGDRAGRDAAWRALDNALPVMREGRQIRFMFLPDGEDPDTQVRRIGKQAFEHEIAQAIPFSTFFFTTLTQRVDTQSIDGRAQLVEQARPLLGKLPPGVYRQMMSQQLAQLARMEVAQIETVLAKPSAQTGPHPPLQHVPNKGLKTAKAPPSPVRKALRLLLYHPNLAQQAGDPHRFDDLALPGLNLLIEVLEILQDKPHLSSSGLLERWRDSEYERHLAKLAMWQPEPEAREEISLESEFLGSLNTLDTMRLEDRLSILQAKSEHGSLSAEEKAQFRDLSAQLFRQSHVDNQ